MNLEKRKKCHHIENILKSTETAQNSAYQDMDGENNRAIALRKELDIFINERKAFLTGTAIEATGFGKRKGAVGAIIGVGKSIADVHEINKKIAKTSSELKTSLNKQNEHQKLANQLENTAKSLRERLDQMGGRWQV